jgi:uncharacterized membrane protein
MESGLTYNEKPTWRDKKAPPGLVKFYGVMMFSLACAYLWAFHHHHTSILYQAALALVAIGLAALLVSRWSNDAKLSESLKFIIVAQCVAQTIALFRPW